MKMKYFISSLTQESLSDHSKRIKRFFLIQVKHVCGKKN